MRIATCQPPELLGDVDAALTCVEGFAARADADLLLFPECFLQGYLITGDHVRRHALALGSPEFAAVLRRLSAVQPTLVFGLIERAGPRLHNTAAVIHRGMLLGAYRKVHLTRGEAIFTPGDDYPVFDLGGVRAGINICADARHPAAAVAVAAQGATMLLVPAQNMMRRAAAEVWKDRHHEMRAARARETEMWVVSSDVTGVRDGDRVGWGPTSIIDPNGELVAQVPLMSIGLITADIAARPCHKPPLRNWPAHPW